MSNVNRYRPGGTRSGPSERARPSSSVTPEARRSRSRRRARPAYRHPGRGSAERGVEDVRRQLAHAAGSNRVRRRRSAIWRSWSATSASLVGVGELEPPVQLGEDLGAGPAGGADEEDAAEPLLVGPVAVGHRLDECGVLGGRGGLLGGAQPGRPSRRSGGARRAPRRPRPASATARRGRPTPTSESTDGYGQPDATSSTQRVTCRAVVNRDRVSGPSSIIVPPPCSDPQSRTGTVRDVPPTRRKPQRDRARGRRGHAARRPEGAGGDLARRRRAPAARRRLRARRRRPGSGAPTRPARCVPDDARVTAVVAERWADGLGESLRTGPRARHRRRGRGHAGGPARHPGERGRPARRGRTAHAPAGGVRRPAGPSRPHRPRTTGRRWPTRSTGDRGARAYLVAHGVVEVECGDLHDGLDEDVSRTADPARHPPTAPAPGGTP